MFTLVSPVALLGADALSTWHLRHVLSSFGLVAESVAYGNGVFVAPVQNSTQGGTTVLRSSDGTTWTRYIPAGSGCGEVTFIGGAFRWCGVVSSNGLLWVSIPGNFSNRIATNGDTFVGIQQNSTSVY